MAIRGNHYDAAFEAYLRARRTPYVAVDEQRRALLGVASIKSMDFIVYSEQKPNLLVDVKGRRFPSGDAHVGHKWENWATAEDIPSLLTWQQMFGDGFRAMLVFAYHVVSESALSSFDELFTFRERSYAFFGVWVDDFQASMQTRSASWATVALPSGAYRELRSPMTQFL